MNSAFEFTLNGRSIRVADVSPNTTLLDYLRDSGLTGSKEGCAEGDCGACSVAIIERGSDGKPTYRAVNSCIMPVCLVAGREVVSVEGVGCSTHPHPVQQQMVEHLGSQCGYCTPGFICSMFEGYYRNDLHTHDDLDEQLAGNLCRCTGYRPIRDAAVEAIQCGVRNVECGIKDEFSERLKHSETKLNVAAYEASGEKFLRPTTLAELLAFVKTHPEGRIIAGATELGLEITKRYKKFSTLISTEAVVELKEIASTASEWHIGAAVTLTEIEDRLGKEFPMLGDMLRVFGSRQIRNRATMGGNIVTASPIGDSAPCLLALDASVVLASEKGERTLPVGEFFLAYRKTALQAGEVLKTIIIPRGISAAGLTRKAAWFKVSKRREMDISTVAGAFVVDLDSQNVIRHVRLGYGGVAALPSRARQTEAALLGKAWSVEALQSLLPILRTEFAPISDVRGTAEYRGRLITSLLEKFFYSVGDEATSLNLGKQSQSLLTSSPTKTIPHESAHKHVTGEAMYVDDQTCGKNFLEVWPVCAPHAHAKILKRDATVARHMPGIKAVLLAEDVPGRNDVGAVKQDEILLADKEVLFHGHLVALVVGDSLEACRAAAEKVVVEYEPLTPILTLREAITKSSFHNESNFIRRGDVEKVFGGAGSLTSGAAVGATPGFRRDA